MNFIQNLYRTLTLTLRLANFYMSVVVFFYSALKNQSSKSLSSFELSSTYFPSHALIHSLKWYVAPQVPFIKSFRSKESFWEQLTFQTFLSLTHITNYILHLYGLNTNIIGEKWTIFILSTSILFYYINKCCLLAPSKLIWWSCLGLYNKQLKDTCQEFAKIFLIQFYFTEWYITYLNWKLTHSWEEGEIYILVTSKA